MRQKYIGYPSMTLNPGRKHIHQVESKKMFLKLNYLGTKNENKAKNRPFYEKINSLGQYLYIPQIDFVYYYKTSSNWAI